VAHRKAIEGVPKCKILKLGRNAIRSASGECAGPILFLIFINDLDTVVRIVEIVKKFADVTKIGQRVASDRER
jgi:hypothetical protein